MIRFLPTNEAKNIIENNTTAVGRAFDLVIQALIIFSVLSFSIETLPRLSADFREALTIFEMITVLIFTAEYLLRLSVATNKCAFIFSFYGLVDLLSILPFYFSIGLDFRFLRIFRLMRLFSILKLLRFTRALERFYRAFASIKNELLVFLFACGLLLYLSSVGIYLFEHSAQPDVFASVFHSMWWAVATLTTVGYGDIYPVTTGGKIFTTAVLFIGLGIVAVPAGLLASALSQSAKEE